MSKEQPIVTVNDLLQNGPVDERKNDGRRRFEAVITDDDGEIIYAGDGLRGLRTVVGMLLAERRRKRENSQDH